MSPAGRRATRGLGYRGDRVMDVMGRIAMVIGPLGGAALVDEAFWSWIFAINLPFVLATLALVRYLHESVDEESTRRIDYLGTLLVALGLAGPVFALIEQPLYGWRTRASTSHSPESIRFR